MAAITDSLGNKISYTYDSEGRRTGEEMYDPNNVRTYSLNHAYDSSGRISKNIYPDNDEDSYAYDAVGNLVQIINPTGMKTSFTFDALNRVLAVIETEASVTMYAYDGHDNLHSVTDAEGHVTSYTYDDMDNVLTETSPDSGSKNHLYDLSGNRIKTTDANGIDTTYNYDPLNRLISISFGDSNQNITYTYDQGTNGKGRLTSISDPSGTTSLEYDSFDLLAKETRVINGHSFMSVYAYNNDHRLRELVYPSGRTIRYNRNRTGQITGIENITSTTRSLAANIAYRPFGPLTTMTLANGLTETRDYDKSLRLTAKILGSVAGSTYGYNPNGNIVSITDYKDATNSQTFSYDGQQRLTGATGKYGTLAYNYDKIGNRLSETNGGQSETYSYLAGTSKLQSVTGQANITYSTFGVASSWPT